ncbi:MAG: NAD(P)H-hydrate epimerase, partial [Chlamydiia bacterium]|nr:NAD(P)H-hydrate epimerase [Chlamydiia bacterium]
MISKVIFPQEAARLDRLAIQEGCSEEFFVEEAGKKVAGHVLRWAPKKVALLVGKGNKGADCLACGIALIAKGIEVEAFFFFSPDTSSPINRKLRDLFSKQGKVVEIWQGEKCAFHADLLVDGLFGTGFTGSIQGVAEMGIRVANHSMIPMIAIDLPSGVNGTTGAVETVAICAKETVALGFAKIGCFLRDGWNHVGKIWVEDFGLPEKYQKMAHAVAWLPGEKEFILPKIVRNRHKYQAGYLIGVAGSSLMKGAPKLAGLAALRTGAGIVRIFHTGDIGEIPYELIAEKWNLKKLQQEMKRAAALFIGPGMGKRSLRWLEKVSIPVVIDADGL